jgi:cobalamin biosynthesis protein CbiD
MDLRPLAKLAETAGSDPDVVRELAQANTAQHALSLLLEHNADGVIDTVARQALAQSVKLAGPAMDVRLLLFDQKGGVLADVRSKDVELS